MNATRNPIPASSWKHIRGAVTKATESDDFWTADVLTGVLRLLDKQLWILEAHLDRN